MATPVFTPGCLVCSVETTMGTAGGTGNRVWLLAWYVDRNNRIELLMKEESNKFVLKQRSGSAVVKKENGSVVIDPMVDYVVNLSFDRTQFTLTVDGTDILQMTPATSVPTGSVGLQIRSTTLTFNYIAVN